MKRLFLTPVVLLALPAGPALAGFIDRPIVLWRHELELNVGLGLGHQPAPGSDYTGLGTNLEIAYGISSSAELGIRTGIRFGNDGRFTRADQYGRTFETETYGTGNDDVANPEIGLRWALARVSALHLALDTRIYLPIEGGTRFGFLLGLPLSLRAGGRIRLDSGILLPVIFREGRGAQTTVSIPFHLWIQVTWNVSIGILTGVRIQNDSDHRQVPLGVGWAYGLSHATELRAWLLFPDVSGDGSAKTFGLGLGLSARF